MAGIRIGGVALITVCSPPFGALHGTDYAGADGNVYRACTGDVAGAASQYTDFDDGAVTSEGVHNPVLSPDGTQILFELANPSTGFTEIWVVANTPGSTATQLVADGSNYVLHPWWGPDSDTFVYVRGAGGAISGGSIEKDTVSSPGTPDTLKSAGGGKSPFRPQFNPAGTRVAYLYDTDVGGTGELRVMDADGTNDGSIDSAVKYRFTGGQFCWSHDGTMIAYDDGATGANIAYVINADGTGKTQINAVGDAAGAAVRVSDRAWPSDDSYVIIAVPDGFFAGQAAMRAELDGSNTTDLNTSNGSYNQDYFRQMLVANNRIWFIESATKLSSFLLDGSDYQVHLTIDGAAMNNFSSGSGWYYN